jgi:hypothetical protein
MVVAHKKAEKFTGLLIHSFWASSKNYLGTVIWVHRGIQNASMDVRSRTCSICMGGVIERWSPGTLRSLRDDTEIDVPSHPHW